MSRPLAVLALAALVAGCSSDKVNTSIRTDPTGNYATTANFNALERTDFTRAMHDGLADFDVRMKQLEEQAGKLGPAATAAYHDHIDELQAMRRAFAAELTRHDAMLADAWRDHREDVTDMYVDLRKELDDAFEDVIDSGR